MQLLFAGILNIYASARAIDAAAVEAIDMMADNQACREYIHFGLCFSLTYFVDAVANMMPRWHIVFRAAHEKDALGVFANARYRRHWAINM